MRNKVDQLVARFGPNGRVGDFVGDKWGKEYSADNCNGHGSHVAGIAAGATSGVAPGSEIRAIRVADHPSTSVAISAPCVPDRVLSIVD